MELYLRRQIVIAGIIYIGQMLVGYGMGWTAPIIPKLQDPEQSPLPSVISEAGVSWAGSLLYIGTIIGPHVTGSLSNIIGRKPCLVIGGAITALSFIIIIFTRNLAMLFCSRVLKGFGIGIIAVGNIVYIGEIASTNIRGILLTVTGISGTLGTLIVYSVGPYVSYAGTGWLGLGLTLVYVSFVLFIPESPVFQVLKGNEDEARRILIKLGRADETENILATKVNKEEKSNSKEWKEIFTVKSNRTQLAKFVLTGVSRPNFFTLTKHLQNAQMSGVVAIIFYATTIFDLAGSSIEPNIATIVIGVTQLGSSCITPFFVEWSGRKTLLMVSTGLCSISLMVLGIYFYLDHIGDPSIDAIGWLPLVTLIIFFLFYDLGFGIIPATLTGEMFRANIRGPGSALTVTVAWLVGFVVATLFGYTINVVGGHWLFWTFAGSCAVAFFFTAVFVPETKGKSLIEIQEMLS